MQGITVKQLIEALKGENPNAMVALATDCEGNSFSLIPKGEFITNDVYMDNEIGAQEFYFDANDVECDDEKTVADFYGNPHEKKKMTKAIVLWPSN